MGLANLFISVESLDNSFMDRFDSYISFDENERMINECLESFKKNKSYIPFTKLCIAELVLIYKRFLNEKKELKEFNKNKSHEAEFYRTDFESKLVSFLIENLDQNNNTILKTIRITKSKEVDFGAYVMLYGLALGIIKTENSQRNVKQSRATNDEILDILERVRKSEATVPFSSREADKALIDETKDNSELHFENAYEFLLFLGIQAKENDSVKQYVWKNGNRYLEIFTEAYKANEQKQCDKAISLLDKCLILNPIGIAARFEKAESYILKKDFDSAKKELNNLTKYIGNKKDVARYYRRLGYISTEEKQYDLALACFMYSKIFEQSKVADNEIKYLSTIHYNPDMEADPYELFKKNDIKVFRQDMKEWTIKEVTDTIKTIDDAKRFYESIENNIEKEPSDSVVKEEKQIIQKISSTNDFESLLNESPLQSKQPEEKRPEVKKALFCRKCGSKLTPDSLFCQYCGTKVIE